MLRTTVWAKFTAAELQVLELLSRGATDAEIAGALGCSLATVKTHVYHMLAKTGAINRTTLATAFIKGDLESYYRA